MTFNSGIAYSLSFSPISCYMDVSPGVVLKELTFHS